MSHQAIERPRFLNPSTALGIVVTTGIGTAQGLLGKTGLTLALLIVVGGLATVVSVAGLWWADRDARRPVELVLGDGAAQRLHPVTH